jgi:glycosyltransferase involved in cell wall biosynthesis
MAVAVASFAEVIEQEAAAVGVAVRRYDIASASAARGLRHHAGRVRRVLGVCGAVVRRRSRTLLYVSVDAGFGMAYTLLLVLVGRLSRATVFLHHHSVAYLDHRNRLFALLCRMGGGEVNHLVGCDRMARSLRSVYPSAASVRVLPITYAVEGAPLDRGGRPGDSAHEIVLGHLSNLSLEKGLQTVFDTVELARRRGVRCRLLLAGPPHTHADGAALEAGLARLGPEVASHLGPVDGDAREAFFRAVDVFLFPSQYRHESFGLVAGEALVRGRPVIAYRTGCLDAELVAGAGTVLDPREPFAERAVAWLQGVFGDAEARRSAETAAAGFVATRDRGLRAAHEVARSIVRSASSAEE